MILSREASSPSLIGGVHILHVAEGLDRLMGNRALYLQMLRRFRHHYPSAMGPIRHALQQGDAVLARQLAHTLKGAAGLIGALHLHRLALTLEADIAAGDMACTAMLDQVQAALTSVLGVLDRVLDEVPEERPQPDGATPAPDDLDAAKLLQRLARLLEDGDGAAIDVLEQSADLLAASLGLTVFGEMAAAAHRFDFEAALAALGPALEAAS